MNQDIIKRDRMRFTKNRASANLIYLSILFNVLYFVSIYSSNAGNFYYSITMGVSVVYNLLFLLIAFLSSEGVKSYKLSYAIIITVVGALQLVRIFGYPVSASSATLTSGEVVMGTRQLVYTVTMLLLSSATAIASGVIGIVRSMRLSAYNRTLEKGN